MGIRRISAKNAKGRRGFTDWQKVKSMTDDEIRKAALTDPQAKELRGDELAKFKKEKR